jgi:hypothetical protein
MPDNKKEKRCGEMSNEKKKERLEEINVLREVSC